MKRSLFVVRILRELNRILNGVKQRQIAPASHILSYWLLSADHVGGR